MVLFWSFSGGSGSPAPPRARLLAPDRFPPRRFWPQASDSRPLGAETCHEPSLLLTPARAPEWSPSLWSFSSSRVRRCPTWRFKEFPRRHGLLRLRLARRRATSLAVTP